MLLEQWPIENSLPAEKDKGLQQLGRLSGKEQNGDPRKRVLVLRPPGRPWHHQHPHPAPGASETFLSWRLWKHEAQNFSKHGQGCPCLRHPPSTC